MKREKLTAILIGFLILTFIFPFSAFSEKKSDLEKAVEVLENEASLEDPKDIMAWVNVPRIAKVGEPISLKILIENCRVKKKLKLSSLDIWDEFLGGFQILEIIPEPRHQDHSFGGLTIEYPRDLKPRETLEIEIKLKAIKAGIFIGDVDVNEGEKFLTRAAQIRIE